MKFFGYCVFLLGGLLFLNSCTIYNKVHFNKDYSGTYEMQLDLESILMMASMMDSTGTMSEDDLIAQIRDQMGNDDVTGKINDMEGISNAETVINKEEGFVIRFDFKDLKALNNSFSELQSQMGDMGGMEGEADAPEPEPYDAFVLLGKKTLVFRSFPKDPAQENLFPEGEEGGEDMFGDMSELIQMKIDLTFDRKVKSVEAKGIEILAQESKRVLGDVDMQEAVSGDGYQLKVKLK